MQADFRRLRYVNDSTPGIARLRTRAGFRYVAANGSSVRDAKTLERIRALAIPPAYESVWICPYDDGHVQATARDARGRKQYRYHEQWSAQRDATKYARLVDFAKALPLIRKRYARDLRRKGTSREKILAAVVYLLETTSIRIGNEEYARANGSFGLTTLRNRHARVRSAKTTFTFAGKSGVRHCVTLDDRRLARIVRACQELPGQRLFEFTDEQGNVHALESGDVNEYIREIAGPDVSAKDFRTWLGTVECATILAALPEADSESGRKAQIAGALRAVAQRLGNTPAVCRKCYVHPAILEKFLERGAAGLQPRRKRGVRGLRGDESRVAALLSL